MSGFSWQAFNELPVIGILRGFTAEEVDPILTALARGGLKNVEITMNSEGAEDQIRLARRVAGGQMNVGAGTVCGLADLQRALEAGAEFIVAPVVVPEVIQKCREASVPIIPGAFTPTEIHRAWELGADLVKVFPADVLGPAYIQSVKAPLPSVKLLPTGGITVESLAKYRRAGADGFGVGSPLVPRTRVVARDWAWIEAEARRFGEAYREAVP
ncbi:MAG TPA: bifunctional 4-hydroxy-2-oxoglutarate aldolase/2-dehydro-3-deoxy-phosphogluconate aldolase [Planctomycetota bacterium]|jgi:2-dehydro-3-deoxyphosphogluconate aldolase/(4S)-4-hydroxy-2-oxoglutarate aldolase|nr:bifunctional 4-hydroxy-2-oxoglutarate aldolase/2-dehydro-3-deoxy-phosphogluconate aldolase [Planctomycetota bacterium]